MAIGRSQRLANLCATVLIALVALAGPAQAGSRDNAHFAKTFKAFCARMMNDFRPIHDFARQQRLRRAMPDDSSGEAMKNVHRWELRHEGRHYFWGINRMPYSKSVTGYANFCLLQSDKADIAGTAEQLKRTFRGQIVETEPISELGANSRAFGVKGFADVGNLIIAVRRRPGWPVSLLAVKVFE